LLAGQADRLGRRSGERHPTAATGAGRTGDRGRAYDQAAAYGAGLRCGCAGRALRHAVAGVLAGGECHTLERGERQSDERGGGPMKTRYSYGGDEHIFVEVDEEMSLEAFFKSLSMTNAVRESRVKGVTEICPANASFQIKFDPDAIKGDDLLAELKKLEHGAEKGDSVLKTRIIEIPVFYNDPWTRETLMRFRERHQDPKSTDIEYAARINNLGGIDGFIKAHSGSPWFVSMVGFVAGLPFLYQMVDRQHQIEVPKY